MFHKNKTRETTENGVEPCWNRVEGERRLVWAAGRGREDLVERMLLEEHPPPPPLPPPRQSSLDHLRPPPPPPSSPPPGLNDRDSTGRNQRREWRNGRSQQVKGPLQSPRRVQGIEYPDEKASAIFKLGME
ncbi:hypothetical protein AAG570_004643 [Ranatra chinensis]|uniref:Uncharacterized protein n=1 Tax=Ranatra chinensis TaxID=642074 RepID=A0ABD0Y1G1_9HEMI